MNPKFNVGSEVIADGDVATITQIIPPPDSDMFTGPISHAVEWPTNEWGTFTEDELKESDFNTPTDEEMEEMMKNPQFADYINSMQPSLPKAEPWPPEPGTWNRNRNKEK